MTIKNKMLLSAVASATLAGSLFAGSITVGEEKGSISKELLEVVGELNVSMGNVVYNSGIDGSGVAANPAIHFTFGVLPTGYESSGTYNTIDIVEVNPETNDTVALNGSIVSSGFTVDADAKKFIFRASNSASAVPVTTGRKYMMMQSGELNTSDETKRAELNVTVTSANAEQVQVGATVYDGSNVIRDEVGEEPLYELKDQFCVSVGDKFDGKIDIANSSKTFVGQVTDTDSMSLTVKDNDLTYELNSTSPQYGGLVGLFVQVKSENNITGSNPDVNVTYNSGDVISDVNWSTATFDMNVTLDEGNLTNKRDSALLFSTTADGTNEIKEAKFEAKLWVSADKNVSVSCGDFAGSVEYKEAGKWTPYGYVAKIPSVTASEANGIDTTIILTNRSTAEQNVFFTIYDTAGTECKVDTTNENLDAIAINGTNKYKMTALETECAGTGLVGPVYAVEVTVPTAPTNVYGFTSFKNSNLNQFKDLPMYHTGSTDYAY